MRTFLAVLMVVVALPVMAGEPGKQFGAITIPAAEAPVKQAAPVYQPAPEPPQTVYIETAPAPSVFDAVKTAVWDWPLGLASRSFRATGDLAADTIDAGRRFGGAVVATAHEVQ